MRRTSPIQPVACSEFLFHIATDQVGVVASVCTSGMETLKTIRLAGGELLSAPAGEFRPATDGEVQARHRVAASIRPLVLPALPAVQSRARSRLHGGWPAL
ncbi:MAG: hypothetical protein ABSA69_09600 [Verrucomicrobiota bacterium]|jgi:hypothetical protein